jgi:hypothetical protein
VTHSERRLELAATVLLAMAAVATAWASYQSSRWHGKQAEAQSASIAARVESSKAANVANRQVQIDVALFTQWVDAYATGQTELAAFCRKRFRDEFEPAFEAWVATKPLRNADAPLSPFAMPQYQLDATKDAERLEAVAAEASHQVRVDIQRADNYVSRSSSSRRRSSSRASTDCSQGSQVAILALGYILFVGAAIWIATFP